MKTQQELEAILNDRIKEGIDKILDNVPRIFIGTTGMVDFRFYEEIVARTCAHIIGLKFLIQMLERAPEMPTGRIIEALESLLTDLEKGTPDETDNTEENS